MILKTMSVQAVRLNRHRFFSLRFLAPGLQDSFSLDIYA